MTVIVVTYNSREHLDSLLSSLPAGLQDVHRWELVVVDNDSSDGTPDLVCQLAPEAVLIKMGRNAGYAAAINAGMSAADSAGPVLILNPDVRLREGLARRLLAALRDPRVGIAVPQLRAADGEIAKSLRRDPTVGRVWAEAILGGRRAAALGASEVISDADAYSHARDVDWATGAVLAVAPECREDVGAWDESFFLYSEEVDYCQRARAAGFAIRYVPEAVAEHASGPYGGDVDLWRLLVANRLRSFQRQNGLLASALFRFGLIVGEALRSASPAHRAGILAALTARDHSSTPRAQRWSVRPRQAAHTEAPGFVWFAAQDWWYHNQAHSDFQLMREVARSQPVLMINSLGLRMPRRGKSTHPGRRILRKLRSFSKLVRRPIPDNPGYHVMTPVFLPFYGDTRRARANAWAVRQQIRIVSRCIGIGRDCAIGVTIPTAWPVVRTMHRSALLYNRSDLHSAFPEADSNWIRSLENQLLDHSERVLYVSRELMRSDGHRVGDRAVFLDHGVDLEHFNFDDTSVAPEVAVIPHPRVGFFGGLDDYVVDIDLIIKAAKALPECQLVLIGDATCNMGELTKLPNVHWLGYRPYEQIPGLGRGFDVAIMPWLDNEWIRFANPIKLKEYLALGLPVVTTEYPEIEAYREEVLVARDREEFPALIRKALAFPGDPKQRRESVMEYSWRARARILVHVVEEVRGPRCVG